MSVKLGLKTITLCAVGSHDRLPTARALDISNSHCDFADSILFSHEPVDGSFRNVKIERPGSMNAYTDFILKGLVQHIQTPFVLVTQWDGYVIDPLAWSKEFLQFDYIGSRWGWLPEGEQVGNGGFSLRSRRLLETMAGGDFPIPPDRPEDSIICHVYREKLEREHGIRFAPPAVADQFAYENINPSAPTFGFHGFLNFWRHVPDDELGPLLDQLPPSIYRNEHCGRLAATYCLHQRWVPLRTLYRRMRKHVEFPDAARQIQPAVPPDLLAWCLQACEKLL
jgi:hypothetical protein